MLKITNLNKNYRKHNVLNNLNLEVPTGTIKALIGVNGSGKSTLVDLVCGVKTFDSGEILINGISNKDKKMRNQIKYLIGYMPQNICLFNDLTVEENLKYLSAIYKLDTDIDALLEQCYLKDHRKTLTNNLSGGYKQLLSLASALIHSPKFLILDEPTSAMDPVFRRNFWKIIKNYNKDGNTILVITHYLEEILECKHFACLSEGKRKRNQSLN